MSRSVDASTSTTGRTGVAQEPRSRRARLLAAYGVSAACFILLMGSWIFAAASDRPLGSMTRDLNQLTGLGPSFGLISAVGVMLWAGSLGVACFALYFVRGSNRRAWAVWAGFTLLLLVDDAFILHDIVLPNAGIPEKVVYLVYVVAGVVWLAVILPLVTRAGTAHMVIVAVGLMAFSVAADVVDVQRFGDDVLMVFEDGSKLLGVGMYFSAVVATARHSVVDGTRAAVAAESFYGRMEDRQRALTSVN